MDDKLDTLSLLADAEGIARAVEILRAGRIVAIPTETVYGLAGRADSAEAVAKIYTAKGRPGYNPLIVHIANLEQAALFTDLERPVADWSGGLVEPTLKRFAEVQWQQSTTLVVPRRRDAPLAPAVTAGLETVALRLPINHIARAVIERAGPLAAPSANRSGFTSPTSAAHVLATLAGRIDAVLDAGPTQAGLESTILKLEPDGRWRELRPGPAETHNWHGSFFDPAHAPATPARIEAPGQLDRHYSPGKPVRLNALAVEPDEFLIGFGAVAGAVTLSAAGDLQEAARRLYAALHEGAASEKPRIAVAPIRAEGIGVAINDRLRRAATP